jgi:hypothetical protein
VTATVALPGDTMSIAGTAVASGEPSEPIALSLGDNPVDIMVENHVGWQQTYRLTLRRAAQLAQYAYGKASNTGIGDELGYSVAIAGDTLAVGAPNEASASQGTDGEQADDSAPESGAVYVFRRSGTSWQQEAYLKASNTGEGDELGTSVTLSGDTLAVGAGGEDSASQGPEGDQANDDAPKSGAVYVFRRTGTSWQQEAYVKASNTSVYAGFGISVALSGDTLAVGAPGRGAICVLRRTDAVWQQQAYLEASNTGAGDFFGWSVALSDDTLAVGARWEDSAATEINGNQASDAAWNSGAVYVFH